MQRKTEREVHCKRCPEEEVRFQINQLMAALALDSNFQSRLIESEGRLSGRHGRLISPRFFVSCLRQPDDPFYLLPTRPRPRRAVKVFGMKNSGKCKWLPSKDLCLRQIARLNARVIIDFPVRRDTKKKKKMKSVMAFSMIKSKGRGEANDAIKPHVFYSSAEYHLVASLQRF